MLRRIPALCLLLLVACGSGRAATIPTATTAATTAPSTTTTTVETTTTAPPTTVPPSTAPPTEPSHRSRVTFEQPWIPFGVAEDVTLHFPSSRVEHVGFHQSNDEGARHVEPIDTGVPTTTMESRDRLSDRNSSADVVVDPDMPLRSPVTGTVISTGSYNLYCDLYDYFINIEPDEHPGWKVRILHITGVEVGVGDHVEAGVTGIAPGARQLPFASQVDDLRTADPAWPHVHIEVSDPSIPNVANPGSGYESC